MSSFRGFRIQSAVFLLDVLQLPHRLALFRRRTASLWAESALSESAGLMLRRRIASMTTSLWRRSLTRLLRALFACFIDYNIGVEVLSESGRWTAVLSSGTTGRQSRPDNHRASPVALTSATAIPPLHCIFFRGEILRPTSPALPLPLRRTH